MAEFDIFCDSGANIPHELVKKHGIKVITYYFTVNGEERACYSEDGNFAEEAKSFYAAVREGAETKTSLISSEYVKAKIEPSLQAGRDVLLTCISAGISGTFNQMREAASELMEKYSGRKVIVCDAVNASMGEGLLVLHAVRMRDSGESIEACAEWLEKNKYNINSYLTVGDLKYLRKSGRVSAPLAIAGTILNIKPILRADGCYPAKIVFFDRARGRKKAIAALAEAFDRMAIDPTSQIISICHADSEEDANTLAEMMKARGVKDIIIEYYDLCTGSHVGPGTVALFFYGKDRREEERARSGILSKLAPHKEKAQ